MVQPAYVKDDARNLRYVGHLAAYDIEGNLLWQQGTVDPRVTTSGADEPVQIYDIDAEGENEVLTVMQMGEDTEKYFYIFDGKLVRSIEKKHKLPDQRAHDAIFFANFSGNKTLQDILLKDRYEDIWAMDKDFNQLSIMMVRLDIVCFLLTLTVMKEMNDEQLFLNFPRWQGDMEKRFTRSCRYPLGS